MFTIALVALIRLIPYGFIAINAWSKGYRWLTLAGIWLFAVAIFTYFVNPSGDVRAVLAMISAFFLTMHALDLKPKKRR